jgi:hypothetical protein
MISLSLQLPSYFIIALALVVAQEFRIGDTLVGTNCQWDRVVLSDLDDEALIPSTILPRLRGAPPSVAGQHELRPAGAQCPRQ